LSESLL